MDVSEVLGPQGVGRSCDVSRNFTASYQRALKLRALENFLERSRRNEAMGLVPSFQRGAIRAAAEWNDST